MEWEAEARRVLSQFRAEIVPLRDDPAVADLVQRLQSATWSSATGGRANDVAAFESHRRVFDHPVAGRLLFDTEQLVPVSAPDVRVVVHLPVTGDDSAARLAAVE